MPTPVINAKQCLNSEASHALDEAVSFTRRRGNPLTTSLHAVYAFLSLSPSQLKQACIRARNTAFYNPKVQLKALDFCLSVSLDRLPVSQPCLDEPPVSNSLMAAIKRSQANQRRHPECVMAVKGSQGDLLGNISSTSSVKVDLQHLIVAILDDPIVSRVFTDAGFSSFDVKIAVLRPFQGLYRYPDPDFQRVRFPFTGSCDEEGEYRRILELLRRKKGRNPLLVGTYASEILKGFVEVLERRKDALPMDLCGINVISIENEIVKLSYDSIERQFNEIGLMVEQCLGPGLIVNIGNVRCFLSKEEEGGGMDCVVKMLTKLLQIHGGRIWLIGSAVNDQTFNELISRFPFIEKDWDLQLLPITSIKSSMGETCFKSSLMKSFVPFGGFFSTPPDPKASFNTSFPYNAQCHIFDRRPVQDIPTISKKGVITSFTNLGTDGASNHLKAKPGSTDMSESDSSQSNKQPHLGSFTNDKFLAKLSKPPSSLNHSQTFPSSGVDLGLDLFSDFSNQRKDNFKVIYKALFERVGRQSERLRIISQIVAQSQKNYPRHQRRDIWLHFTGHDMFGKRKTALALSEILYGSKKYLIHTNLSSQVVKFHQEKNFDYSIILEPDAKSRGQIVVDQIAEELRKTPFSVVLLENVQSADQVTQNSLLHAMKNGKFLDSHGREVSVSNRVFVLTSREVENCSTSDFSEARLEKAKGLPLQLVIKNAADSKTWQNSSKIVLCKRKLNNSCEIIQQKLMKGENMSLDLNLPAEITEEDEINDGFWLDELSDDQGVNSLLSKVVFEDYNYDAMAEKIVNLVHTSFCKMTNSKCLLEIESRAMDQLITAACLSEDDKEIEDWIDNVLSKSFGEAQKRYQLMSHFTAMLVSCEGEDLSRDDPVAGEYLPSVVRVT